MIQEVVGACGMWQLIWPGEGDQGRAQREEVSRLSLVVEEWVFQTGNSICKDPKV